MSAPISVTPRVVTVFGDSWSSPVRDKVTPYNTDFLAAYATGLGDSPGGSNYLPANFSWGGVKAEDAVNGTGNFPYAIDSAPGPVTFAQAVDHDFALYQVFRYGINDVAKALQPLLDPSPSRPDYAVWLAQLNAAGLSVTHTVVDYTKWTAYKAAFRGLMAGYFTSLCTSSIGSGRRPVLAKMPRMTPMAVGYWTWSARHDDLMMEVNAAIGTVAAAKGARIVDQTGTTLSTSQRIDHLHPNQEYAWRVSVDFGRKLRTALTGY